MTSAIAVLIPVLDRPHRVRPLVENLAECSTAILCVPLFLVSPHDEAERAELKAAYDDGLTCGTLHVPFPLDAGDYARKINWGFTQTARPDIFFSQRFDFCFLGADDLYFHPGWAERAIAAWHETHACVIGTNDLANPAVKRGLHATHSLVHRDYGECGTIDEKGKLLHEGYFHEFVDNEFIETAKARGTFHFADDVHVQHAHPTWHTAEMDATYARGAANHATDFQHYSKRKRLWA